MHHKGKVAIAFVWENFLLIQFMTGLWQTFHHRQDANISRTYRTHLNNNSGEAQDVKFVRIRECSLLKRSTLRQLLHSVNMAPFEKHLFIFLEHFVTTNEALLSGPICNENSKNSFSVTIKKVQECFISWTGPVLCFLGFQRCYFFWVLQKEWTQSASIISVGSLMSDTS